jgi:hypothetical protein
VPPVRDSGFDVLAGVMSLASFFQEFVDWSRFEDRVDNDSLPDGRQIQPMAQG